MLSLDGDVGLVKYMAGVKIGLADSRRMGDLLTGPIYACLGIACG